MTTARIHPGDLPLRRNQLVKHLSDPTAPLRARTGPVSTPGLDALTRHLRAAEQYWVSAPMAALAMSAGVQLTELDAAVTTRPSGCGLIYFDGGIGNLRLAQGLLVHAEEGGPDNVPLEYLPVVGLVWGPFEHEVLVWTLTDRRQLNEAITHHGAELVESEVPRLVPMMAVTIPATPTAVEEISDAIPHAITQALVASWLLMQQPTLTDRSSLQPKKSTRGETSRLGIPDSQVSVVDLRRQYVPDDREETGEERGRRYRHRWVVSGHWRDQAYGPERTLRRKTWIAAYVKGPGGAPLLATEKVNVWRR